MVRATKPAITLHSETGLVGVRVRCPESTQRDSEVHGRGVRGTEGRSLGHKHRERSLPLAIPEPALVVDGRRGRMTVEWCKVLERAMMVIHYPALGGAIVYWN